MQAMSETDPRSAPEAVLAGRAIGAMFFSVFGGMWLVLWTHRAHADRLDILAGVTAVAAAVLAVAILRYRRFRGAALAVAESPEKKKADRMFHLVNAAQWIAIVIIGNVLANTGRPEWVIPAAIAIIGLHFLPLGKLFSNRPHYVTGAALLLLALAYPRLAPAGPADPVGCLGAGLILLASALWAVTVHPARGATAVRPSAT